MPIERNAIVPKENYPVSAFGERLTASLRPEVALIFPYDTVDPSLISTRTTASGAVTQATSMLSVASGASSSSSATMFSRNMVRYSPGEGVDIRFTALFTTGVAGSTQWIGCGDAGEGLFFGYNGADFGVMRRYGGEVTITTLTVSTASSTAEDITITLDGDAATDVSVTNTGDTTLTANEIAAHDYSGVGNGWSATAVGSTVVFSSYDAAVHSGTFTLSSATTAVGTFSGQTTGTAPTEEFTATTDWNVDLANGNGHLPVIDWTKGNVFRIEFQYLGFGAIKFEIEDPRSGLFEPVHVVQYPNSNTRPSLDNPTMPLCVSSSNTTNTTDMVIKSGSMMGAVQGRYALLGGQHGIDATGTSIGTSEVPVMTFRNRLYYDGHPNHTKVKLKLIEVGNDHTKTIRFRFYNNATLTGASFSDVSNSPVTVDTSATAFSGGVDFFEMLVASNNTEGFDFGDSAELGFVVPGDQITVTAEATSGSGGVGVISMYWIDLI